MPRNRERPYQEPSPRPPRRGRRGYVAPEPLSNSSDQEGETDNSEILGVLNAITQREISQLANLDAQIQSDLQRLTRPLRTPPLIMTDGAEQFPSHRQFISGSANFYTFNQTLLEQMAELDTPKKLDNGIEVEIQNMTAGRKPLIIKKESHGFTPDFIAERGLTHLYEQLDPELQYTLSVISSLSEYDQKNMCQLLVEANEDTSGEVLKQVTIFLWRIYHYVGDTLHILAKNSPSSVFQQNVIHSKNLIFSLTDATLQLIKSPFLSQWLLRGTGGDDNDPYSDAKLQLARLHQIYYLLHDGFFMLMKHKNRDTLLEQINYRDIGKWTKKNVQAYLKPMLENPKLYPFFKEILFSDSTVFAERSRKIPWEQRLQTFDSIMSKLAHPRHGITEEELQAYTMNGALDVSQRPDLQTLLQQYSSPEASESQKNYIRSVFRMNTPLEAEQIFMQRLQKMKGLSNIEFHDEMLYNATKLRESPYSPLAHLLPLHGSEIEIQLAQKMEKFEWLYKLLDHHGFHKEHDSDMETSPGPFQHPYTTVAVFNRWRNAGLIDFNEYRGHSLHLNFQVKSAELLAVTVRLFHLANRIFHNISDLTNKVTDDDKQTLSIWAKQSKVNFQSYLEVKNFTLPTPESFESEVPKIVHLVAGQQAFEKLLSFRFVREFNLELSIIDGDWRELLVPATQEEIERFKLSTYEVQLIKIWIETMCMFIEGLSQHNLERYALQSAPQKVVRKILLHTLEIFPQKNSRYDVDPNMVQSEYPVTMYGQHFENLVAFSQTIINWGANEIQQVFLTVENDFYQQLYELTQLENKPTHEQLQTFFSLFPCNGASKSDLFLWEPKKLYEHYVNVAQFHGYLTE